MVNYVAVLKEARKQIMLRSNTVSVKDLTLCHRKKVFSTLYPTHLTDEELFDYVSQQASHDNIQKLLMIYPNRFRVEMEVHLPEECYVYDSSGRVFGVYPQGNCAQQIPQQTSGSNISSGNTSSTPYNYYNGTSSSQQNRINWGEICMNPLVDYVITEPCSTLTTPDGYTLTAEGERVLRCLAGGALVGLLAPELLTQIRQLGPAVNCVG